MSVWVLGAQGGLVLPAVGFGCRGVVFGLGVGSGVVVGVVGAVGLEGEGGRAAGRVEVVVFLRTGREGRGLGRESPSMRACGGVVVARGSHRAGFAGEGP